jgi:putative flippase GtrA
MKKIFDLYKKYEEVVKYLFFGVLTTLVNIIVYTICRKCFHIIYMVSKVIAWIVSVLFAYVTNRKYVFESKSDNFVREVYDFYKYRVFSLLIELLIMYVFVEILSIDDMLSNIIVNVIVVILNYIFSKLFVFKKKES